MNRERIVFSIGILKHFINDSLGLKKPEQSVTGFEFNEALLDAAAYNAYLETVSNKTDSLYSRIRGSITSMITYAYLDYIRRLSEKFGWKEKKFMLAFDYTDENFYGKVDGFFIHGWTGQNGITGKFKFLTCSIVSDEIPEKIPLISIPILLGHYKSKAVLYCLDRIKPYIGDIDLILFDRGFFDKDMMYELSKNGYSFTVFSPKASDKKKILNQMEIGEQKVFIHDFTVSKDSTRYKGEIYLSFLKQIYDPKSEKSYDWVFATNVEEVALRNSIQTYKKRWRIETGYRVQDEAKIKCKSKEMKIRYFLFVYEQMLQTQWMCFYRGEASFKKFLIEMHAVCKDIVANPEKTYGKP